MMYKICALNDKTVGDDDAVRPSEPREASQEEQIAAVRTKYMEALQKHGRQIYEEAITIYKEVLAAPVLSELEPVEDPSKRLPGGQSPIYGNTALQLRYGAAKNLADIYSVTKEYAEAIEFYHAALEIDATDATVWYRAGTVAFKLGIILYASFAFVQGWVVNPRKHLIKERASISLFVQGDYWACLVMISHIFSEETEIDRALILRDLVIEDMPPMRSLIKELSPNINLRFETKFEGPASMKDQLKVEIDYLIEKKREWMKRGERKVITDVDLRNPLTALTWLAVGDSLITMNKWFQSYDHDRPPVGCKINLRNALSQVKCDSNAAKTPEEEVVAPSVVVEAEPEKVIEEIRQAGSTPTETDFHEKKVKRRLGSALMEELLWSGKRRSARVRSSKKEHEAMSVVDALRNILPRKLLHKIKVQSREEKKILDDDSMDTMDIYRLFEKQESIEDENSNKKIDDSDAKLPVDKYFGSADEENDVREFLENNDGLLIFEIFKNYLTKIESLWRIKWPKKLTSVFIDLYKAYLPFNPALYRTFETAEVRQQVMENIYILLLYHELSQDVAETAMKMKSFIDMQELLSVECLQSEFSDDTTFATFVLRCKWLLIHSFLRCGKSGLVLSSLQDALDFYTEFPLLEHSVIKLTNCRRNNIISKDVIIATLDAQSRKKSLAEIIHLYKSDSYEEVTLLLKESLKTEGALPKDTDDELLDRETQISMLINSLYAMDNFKECVPWLETCCHDLLSQTGGREDVDCNEWKVVFDRLLVSIEDCCDNGNFKIIDALPQPRLARLVQTLCLAICRQTEDLERPPCASRPWMILSRILVSLEESETSWSNVSEDEDEFDIPPSVLLLFTAHEYLGRREWCNCDGNVLLFLIMDQVIPKIRLPEWAPYRETVQQHVEQVVFCLYGHPSKKSKARYLTDHNVAPIPLTWQRSLQLFELFQPDEMPFYDSARTSLMSSDTEVLLRRMTALIPDDIDPAQFSEDVESFIYGRSSVIPDSRVELPGNIKHIFYILGDYYFKTHESAKAVKYLMIDLCLNPKRADTWASIALSKESMLEFQLNSCDTIKTEDFLEEVMSTVLCYEHSLTLDRELCTLWIEYGSFAFTVHSYCSQRMKLESDSLSLEQFEDLETTKTKMLDAAKRAFINADAIWSKVEDTEKQDERWLHHYMLGKICEKYGDLSYFDHYQKASELLYENDAQYPKKIGYNSTPTYAIEAMEVYFRVHVCVIKCLELNDYDSLDEKTREQFEKALNFCANSPFVKQMSKADALKVKAREAEEQEEEKLRDTLMIKSILEDIFNRAVKGSEDKKIVDANEEVNPPETPVESTNDPLKNDKMEAVASEIKEEKNEFEADTQNDEVKQSFSDEVVQGPKSEELDDEMDYTEQETRKDEFDVGSAQLPFSSDENFYKSAAVRSTEYAAISYATPCSLPPNEPIPYDMQTVTTFEPYPHEQLPDDNCYLTLEDFQVPPAREVQKPIKQRLSPTKRRCSIRAKSSESSGSSSSEDIKYDDVSSSSSSDSEPSSCYASPSSDTDSIKHAKKRKRKKKHSSKSAKIASDDPIVINDGTDTPKEVETEKEMPSTEETVEAESEITKPELSPLPLDPEEAIVQQCLRAFETCAIRFPQHYKSIYRLAHFFYRSKKYKNLEKCRSLLLGQYETKHGKVGGLFADRRNTNFFNGIWRLPVGDVDRPGSFASHMSRSILLLLEVLRDLRDHKLLLELCLQLRKVPEQDKRYLREDERVLMSKQALTLSIQTLRSTVRERDVEMTWPVVYDTYRDYRQVQKNYPTKEPAFADCLIEAVKRYKKYEKCSLEFCLRYCQAEISGKELPVPEHVSSPFLKKRKYEKKLNGAKLSKQPIKKDIFKEVKTTPSEPPKVVEKVMEIKPINSSMETSCPPSQTENPTNVEKLDVVVIPPASIEVPKISLPPGTVLDPVKNTNKVKEINDQICAAPPVSDLPAKLPELAKYPSDNRPPQSELINKIINEMLVESSSLLEKQSRSVPSFTETTELKLRPANLDVKQPKQKTANSEGREPKQKLGSSDGKDLKIPSSSADIKTSYTVKDMKMASKVNPLLDLQSLQQASNKVAASMNNFPMLNQAPFFGLPIDFSSDAYSNQYAFMAQYFAQIQGQSATAEKISKASKTKQTYPTPHSLDIKHRSKTSSAQHGPSTAVSSVASHKKSAPDRMQSSSYQPSTVPHSSSFTTHSTSITKNTIPPAHTKKQPSMPPPMTSRSYGHSMSQASLPQKPVSPTSLALLSQYKSQKFSSSDSGRSSAPNSPSYFHPSTTKESGYAQVPFSTPSRSIPQPPASTKRYQPSPPDPRPKFDIESILGKKSEISISITKKDSRNTQPQVEAINLSPDRKSQNDPSRKPHLDVSSAPRQSLDFGAPIAPQRPMPSESQYSGHKRQTEPTGGSDPKKKCVVEPDVVTLD